MVDQTRTVRRLVAEREYEDRIVELLSVHTLNCLEDIPDLGQDAKERIRTLLEVIITDSRRHADTFNQLIQMVYDRGEAEY
jgi:hypothetical protein